VLAACADADLVISDKRHMHRIDRQVLAAMKQCRLIQVPAAGYDTVDHRAAAELGIPVANAAGYNKEAVADWTLMAMLAMLRHSFHGERAMRAGRWGPDDRMREEMIGHELGAMTVGIIGLGNVGSSVAKRVAAFGSRILFTDIVTRDSAGAQRVDLDTLLRESDIICIHTPLDVETGALIGDEALLKMKKGACLINAARGPIVAEDALIKALSSGRLAGAALDVYEVEPLATDSPLRAFENVILSPHIAGATFEADVRLMQVVSDNLLRVLEGRPPMYVVNSVEVGAR
jgi:D-3-phosphoglycerate dehydrogenase